MPSATARACVALAALAAAITLLSGVTLFTLLARVTAWTDVCVWLGATDCEDAASAVPIPARALA